MELLSKGWNMVEFDARKRITIDKIVICGFSAIESKIEVKFDKHTNLIDSSTNDLNLYDGPANDLKLAIPLAIDFMLNPTYQDEQLALRTRNQKVPADKSFVRLHISSEFEFELNGTDGYNFAVTRRAGSINLVTISCNGQKAKKQAIHLFYKQLNLLQFSRIDDVVISERTCPTSSDLNKIFIGAINLKAPPDDIQRNRFADKKNNFGIIAKILQVQKRHKNEAKKHLTELRTLEMAILLKELEILNSKPSNEFHAARSNQREIGLLLQAAKFESIQRRRFEKYKHLISNTEFRFDPIDLADFEGSLEEFMASWKEYTEDMKNAREIGWEVKEYEEMTNMKACLRFHFNQRVTVAEFISDCDKTVHNAQLRLQTLYGTEGYKRNKRLAGEICKSIEDQRRKLDDELMKLKVLEQQQLDNEVEGFQKSRDFMVFTNQLALAQMTIEEFFLLQTLLNPIWIESWRAGFMALTLKTAYDKEIPQNFVGNVFDFVNPDVSDAKLKICLPLLGQYFALFFFKTKSAAIEFKKLVTPFLKNGMHVYTHVITEVDQARLANLPYASLADEILSEEIRAENPLIKNWFDNIRICKNKAKANPNAIHDLAIKHSCKIIFFENKCYHEDGLLSEVLNGKPDGAMKDFLKKWQKIQRNVKLEVQAEKFVIDNHISAMEQTQNDLKKQCLDSKVKIIDHFIGITADMKKLVLNTDVCNKYANLEMGQKLRIKINQAKKALLEAGNPTPLIEMKDMPQVPLVEAIALKNSITESEKNAAKITDSFIKKMIPLHPDAINKHKDVIEGLQEDLPNLDTFDYKQQFKVMTVQSPDELKELCDNVDGKLLDQKIIIKELQAKTSKLGTIKKYPELLDITQAENLAELSLENLRQLKQDALDRVPKTLPLPNLDADFQAFLLEYKADFVMHMPEAQKENNHMNNLLVALYFDNLLKVLEILNKLFDNGNEVIGFEVESMDGIVHVFPGMKDKPWFNRFSIKNLCDCTTGLSFISKKGNDIITSDLLRVKSRRLCLLLHLVLSVRMNPSVIILNNTIVGHPVDSLQKIIQRFQLVPEYNDGIRASDRQATRQVIVVARSPGCYHRKLLEQDHKNIQCEMVDNKPRIRYESFKRV